MCCAIHSLPEELRLGRLARVSGSRMESWGWTSTVAWRSCARYRPFLPAQWESCWRAGWRGGWAAATRGCGSAWAGGRVLARVIERVGPQCVGAGAQRQWRCRAGSQAFGLPVIADDVGGCIRGRWRGCWPGLESGGGDWVRLAWVVSVPGDCAVPAATTWSSRLESGLRFGADRRRRWRWRGSGGRTHPVVGVWPVAMRDAVAGGAGGRVCARWDRSPTEAVVVEWALIERDGGAGRPVPTTSTRRRSCRAAEDLLAAGLRQA